jgi:D-amino peptidase
MLRALPLTALCLAAATTLSAQRPLKVYISADMEGITGVASVDQLGPASFEYQQARTWMTAEVLAAIQGAREAGATEFVISDSHGNGESLLIDKFPSDVPITIVRSFPRPLGRLARYVVTTCNPAGALGEALTRDCLWLRNAVRRSHRGCR